MNDIRISAVGDIMPGDHYFSLGHGLGEIGRNGRFDDIFSQVKPYFQASDIVFGNLEGPLSNRTKATNSVGKVAFIGSPLVAHSLSKVGFNVINIANNHMLQHGEDAFDDTVELLINAGIDVVGLKGTSQYSSEPVIKSIKGKKIGILGYSFIKERYVNENNKYSSYQRENLINDLKLLKETVDLIVVSIHIGEEGISYPTRETVEELSEISSYGADIVLGHHTHIFQPVSYLNNKLIATNLGDFVFDLHWDTRLIESAILDVVIKEDNTLSHKLTAVFLDNKNKLQIMSEKRKNAFLERLNAVKSSMEIEDIYYEKILLKEQKKTEMFMQVKKYMYFVFNLYKGSFVMKLKFLLWKLHLVN